MVLLRESIPTVFCYMEPTIYYTLPASADQRTMFDVLVGWHIEENLLENLVGKLVDVHHIIIIALCLRATNRV